MKNFFQEFKQSLKKTFSFNFHNSIDIMRFARWCLAALIVVSFFLLELDVVHGGLTAVFGILFWLAVIALIALSVVIHVKKTKELKGKSY